MNKRLTDTQKMFAIYLVFMNAEHPLSVKQIGLKIGFKSGAPIQDLIHQFRDEQRFRVYTDMVCGKEVEYYWMDETDLITLKEYIEIMGEEI